MQNPIHFDALDHLVLRVVDLPRMERFYTEILGMQVERRLDDVALVQLRAGTSLLDLVPVDSPLGRKGGGKPDRDGPNMDHFCWSLEPFEPKELIPYLKAKGVSVGEIEQRYGAKGFGPSIYIQDPEGNTVELKGPPERAIP
ncbi:MAG: VOC family protein [Limnobacter sp.]|nr:VOC family protein [Limnobacter sp.]